MNPTSKIECVRLTNKPDVWQQTSGVFSAQVERYKLFQYIEDVLLQEYFVLNCGIIRIIVALGLVGLAFLMQAWFLAPVKDSAITHFNWDSNNGFHQILHAYDSKISIYIMCLLISPVGYRAMYNTVLIFNRDFRSRLSLNGRTCIDTSKILLLVLMKPNYPYTYWANANYSPGNVRWKVRP